MAMLGGECSPCCGGVRGWSCYKVCPHRFFIENPPSDEETDLGIFREMNMGGGVLRADGSVALIEPTRLILYKNATFSAIPLVTAAGPILGGVPTPIGMQGRGGREAVIMQRVSGEASDAAVLLPGREQQRFHNWLDFVDVDSGTYNRSELPLPGIQGEYNFEGGVRISSRRIVLVPARYRRMVIVEMPIRRTLGHEPYILGAFHDQGRAGNPPLFERNPAFSGGVLLQDRTVMLCPSYGSDSVGLYDPDSDTYENGPAATRYNWPILLPDGRVLMTPGFGNSNNNLAFYDHSNRSVSLGPPLPDLPTDRENYRGGALTPCNQVVLAPYAKEARFAVYDIASDSIIEGPDNPSDAVTLGGQFENFKGAVAAPDGTVLLVSDGTGVIAGYTSCQHIRRGFGF